MKIDSKIAAYEISKHLPNTTSGVADDKQSTKDAKTEIKGTQDTDTIVSFSRASREVQLADNIISHTPDVRADKVAEIKDKIESGTYEIDHEEIASKLIDSNLEEIL
jgi:negative regulator of flagellin synthesis FlgM